MKNKFKKMPALSFKVFKEKLLSGEKRQTIRPIRKRSFKVGDKLVLYWKQRTKKCCGSCLHFKILKNQTYDYWCNCKKFGFTDRDRCDDLCRDYNHKIGVFTCTIAEIIELSIDDGDPTKWHINWITPHGIFDSADNLAIKDGFSCAEQMFEWFDKEHDLSEPKRFQVIRW